MAKNGAEALKTATHDKKYIYIKIAVFRLFSFLAAGGYTGDCIGSVAFWPQSTICLQFEVS